MRWYWYCLFWSALGGAEVLLEMGMSLTFRASSRIRTKLVFRGVYLVKCETQASWSGMFLLTQLDNSSTLTWFLNSLNTSSYMNLAALWLNSSRFVVSFLHKLSEKGLGLRVVTMWGMATSGFRFGMLRATFPNLSINM